MIRLNLGCGNPNAESWHPQPGYVNRDPAFDGWRFEDGLGEYADGSVEAVTISHSSMYMPIECWPAFYADVARVLCEGGVIRVTEDDCRNPKSRCYPHGWRGSMPAITLTDPEMVKAHMSAAGLVAFDCRTDETHFADDSILQDQHGGEPHVFFVEGVKSRVVLFEPHADDGALSASYTIQQYRARVVTCFGSAGDYGTTEERAQETAEAMAILGAGPLEQWTGGDLVAQMRALDARQRPTLVFAPHPHASHPDHVAVAEAAREVFGDRLRQFHTYDMAGKVKGGRQVEPRPEWILAKLRALACYRSQILHPRACKFFAADLTEWIEP